MKKLGGTFPGEGDDYDRQDYDEKVSKLEHKNFFKRGFFAVVLVKNV